MDDSVKCSERIMTLREATLEKMQMASEQNGNCHFLHGENFTQVN